MLCTKDTDFQVSYELGQGPPQLVLVTTGNIHNDELLALFAQNEELLFRLLVDHTFIELNRDHLIIHG